MIRMTNKTTHVVTSDWSKYTTEEEKLILDQLLLNDHSKVADRLNRLIEMIAENPDVDGLALESVRSIADFFIQNNRPIRPLWPTTMALWQ